ncbi:hypothetical protein ACIHFE_18520 [Streptomyces sp. NPDC052396]|uniref:DUF7848 domain-containing protein n=1 Tax=Streptomyces sp. NPDC052396 TaxID=3365689 RepID=UPI0037CE0977
MRPDKQEHPAGSRSVMRYARWVICSDKVPGNPLVTHELQCVACDELSGPCSELQTAQAWALRHSGANPKHTGYAETARRYWTTSLVEMLD